MSEPVKIIILIICSYMFGNINVALVISKMMKGDVRKMGSGNPGTMNMVRNFGVKIGVLTLLLDALKGAVPALLGGLFIGKDSFSFPLDKLGAYIGAVSVIVGHIFPVVLKFKGGKGIASTIGICLVLNPLAGAISFAAALLFIIVTKMGSIASFIAISIPLAIEGFTVSASGDANALACSILIFSIFCLTLFAHRKNFVKVFKGTESKTVIFKKKNAKHATVFSNEKK